MTGQVLTAPSRRARSTLVRKTGPHTHHPIQSRRQYLARASSRRRGDASLPVSALRGGGSTTGRHAADLGPRPAAAPTAGSAAAGCGPRNPRACRPALSVPQLRGDSARGAARCCPLQALRSHGHRLCGGALWHQPAAPTRGPRSGQSLARRQWTSHDLGLAAPLDQCHWQWRALAGAAACAGAIVVAPDCGAGRHGAIGTGAFLAGERAAESSGLPWRSAHGVMSTV